ncbi:MAG: tRNA pseudouridine(38,39,40) synthase TruA [Cycloclasticus sp. symbiont of Bathymodiolus heckerae]|nr:MAG: tRNA pseudouridine(38,39,40) synthase TruA [Cycloclasticus sp. symbiont of Bathymodiolus heckerae]
MKFALGVEYDGSRYHGWQRQKTTSQTVQGHVEKALSVLASHSVAVVCAGRTDAGVHAYEQVVHFESDKQREMHQWVLGANTNLPADIRVIWIQPVCDDFHARFSAAARYYRYEILNRWVKSALHRNHVTTIFQPLDEALMQQGADYLIGKHDFTSFRAQGCQAKSPIKQIHSISIQRSNDKITIDIIASAFLHHMVRNIVGTLLPVGRSEVKPEWVNAVLLAKDRKQAGVTALPNGLYFKGVYYPQQFGLKSLSAFSPFIDKIEKQSMNLV